MFIASTSAASRLIVSYVFTTSGVCNTGRLGAKGLRSLCRNVQDDQAQPGDIVFF